MEKKYIENGCDMVILLDEVEDNDCYIILDEINNKEHPLRSLRVKLGMGNNEPLKSDYIQLTKAIRDHTTLITFDIDMYLSCLSNNNKLALLFEALKDNRSIKNLRVKSLQFDLETTKAFAQILMNNSTLISLYAEIDNGCIFEENLT